MKVVIISNSPVHFMEFARPFHGIPALKQKLRIAVTSTEPSCKQNYCLGSRHSIIYINIIEFRVWQYWAIKRLETFMIFSLKILLAK